MVGVGNTAEVFDYGDGKVCKLFYQGYPKVAVEREYRNAKEAERLGLPVPKVFEMVESEGRTGIVYEKIVGKSMLDCIMETPAQTGELLEQFVKLQKQWLLTTCSAEVMSYRVFLKGLQENGYGKDASLDTEIDALPEGNVLLHGDFHPGNVLLTPDHRTVVIDFMNVCRGPALYDIARTYFLLQEKDKAFAQAYLAMAEVPEADIMPFYKVIERCRRYER